MDLQDGLGPRPLAHRRRKAVVGDGLRAGLLPVRRRDADVPCKPGPHLHAQGLQVRLHFLDRIRIDALGDIDGITMTLEASKEGIVESFAADLFVAEVELFY